MRSLRVFLVVIGLMTAANAVARPPLSDAPVVWYAQDQAPIPVPQETDPSIIGYAAESFVARPFARFWHPGRFFRWVGTGERGRPAVSVNALGEVLNSSWFTNRIGLRPMSDRELIVGSAVNGRAEGPDRSGPWVIIGAKTAGVTPGFRIRDNQGDVWLLKFDPPSHPGMTIRAGVVTNLFFHAMGYNVPVDRLVRFDRDVLVVGDGATMRLQRHGEVPMTEANLDSVLVATGSVFDGQYHALASRYLDGIPIGPFDDEGRRDDDPNDRVKHQDRRELRALRVFAAWLNHFDTKAQNTLDMYVGEPGQGYVKHYLIDFASSLGAYGDKAVPRFGYEYGLDFFPILGRTLALGFHEDAWVQVHRPEGLDEVGLFVADPFDPTIWKPDLPNSMMANLTRLDAYWAAKIVSAFNDAQIRLLVEQGHYQDPRAVEYLTRTLMARRDRIVHAWFDETPPLDFFTVDEAGLRFHDLAVERGFESAAEVVYRFRWAAVDSDRKGGPWSSWQETSDTFIPEAALQTDAEQEFLAIQCQVRRDQAWSRTVTVYRAVSSGRIVAVDR